MYFQRRNRQVARLDRLKTRPHHPLAFVGPGCGRNIAGLLTAPHLEVAQVIHLGRQFNASAARGFHLEHKLDRFSNAGRRPIDARCHFHWPVSYH
jgi:hypothetical protein